MQRHVASCSKWSGASSCKKVTFSSIVVSDEDRTLSAYGSELSNDSHLASGSHQGNVESSRSTVKLDAVFEKCTDGEKSLGRNKISIESGQLDFSLLLNSTLNATEILPAENVNPSVSSENAVAVVKKNGGRCCRCDLRQNWLSELHAAFVALVSVDMQFVTVRRAFINFETCTSCQPETYPYCEKNETCTDHLKWLRFMAPHSQLLRTLVRVLYDLRMDHVWLLRSEMAIMNGDWAELEDVVESSHYENVTKTFKSVDNGRPNIWALDSISNDTRQAIEDFNKLVATFPTEFCHVCLEVRSDLKKYKHLNEFLSMSENGDYTKPIAAMVANRLIELYDVDHAVDVDMASNASAQMTEAEKFEKLMGDVDAWWHNDENEIRLDLAYAAAPIQMSFDALMSKIDQPSGAEYTSFPASPLKESNYKFRICKKCLTDMKKDIVPANSEFNEMGFDELPAEISSLNDLELTLIKLARTFQCITRLTPMRQCGSNAEHVFALKGLTVHLPLPTVETHEYVLQSLPSTKNMEIIVDNIPTSNKTIWRSLVDMEKVKKALAYLKLNNPLYANVRNCFEDLVDDSIQRMNDEPPIHHVQDPDEDSVPEKITSMLLLSRSHVQHTNLTVIPVDANVPADVTDVQLYKTERVHSKPLNVDDPTLDLKCFPELFPGGRYGMFVPRMRRVGPPEYLKHVLRSIHSRYRRNHQYLMQELHRYDMRSVSQGMFAVMNTRSLRDMTAEQLRFEIDQKAQELEANLSTLFSKVRGSKDYWRQRNSDLAAMDEQLGPATLFVTLSCAEYNWTDMRTVLEVMNSDLPNVHSITAASLCVNDPVTVAVHFKRRVEAFINVVLKNPKGPLGEVAHYFIRVEYQARGAPHIHMKLWLRDDVDGIPIVGKSSDNEVQRFVENYITCAIPSAAENPELAKLVLLYQCHKCGKSCKRFFRVGTKFVCKCRFGFPRLESNEFKVNGFKRALASRKSGRWRQEKLYTVRRQKSEVYVNDYNPGVLLMWQANMDIQMVSESSLGLNNYITGYVTKPDKENTKKAWSAIIDDRNTSLYAKLHKYARQLLQLREVGAYEAADKILGHSLYYLSENVIYVNVQPRSKRNRRILSYKHLANLPADSQNIFHKNMLDDHYPQRPDHLEEVCLRDIVAGYEYIGRKENENERRKQEDRADDEEDEYHALKDGSGYLRKRTRARDKIIKTLRFSTKTDEGKELLYHAALFLCKPWRNEDELIEGFGSYAAAFLANVDKYPRMESFYAMKTASDDVREEAKKAVMEADKAAEEEVDVDEGEDAPDAIPFEAIEGGAIDEPAFAAPTRDEFESMVNSLNVEQRAVYEHVVSVLGAVRDGKTVAPINMIVSGVAGTGKSHLIEALVAAAHLQFGNGQSDLSPVAVLAPTGVAAFNIRGTTIHRFFKLNVQHGKDGELFSLSASDKKMFKTKWRAIRLIIVDEFSMVSNVVLAKIHSRLVEVLGGECFDSGFAGKNIMLFGDLLQLPPVNAKFCFETLSDTESRTLGVVGQYNLWRDFEYRELVQNMRQQDDLSYAELLNRVRLGSPTEADINLLEDRLVEVPETEDDPLMFIAKKFDQQDDKATNAICLLPMNVQVNAFNEKMLELKKIDVVELRADDVRKQKGKKSKKAVAKKNGKKLKASETGGLEDCLTIGVGVRVMLRRNLNVAEGLVNGSLGTVTNLKRVDGAVEFVEVLFDSKQEPVDIEKVCAEFEISPRVFISRKQFPICLAYAITIHKSQGLTLGKVLIDLGSQCFEDAMAYVALSRARRLDQVHLIHFEAHVIRCKASAAEEYNRLRSTYTDLPKLPAFNRLPSSYARVGPRNPMLSRSIEPVSKKKVAAKRRRNQRDASIRTDSSSEASLLYVRFSNVSVSCYANSVVQACLQMSDLEDHVGGGTYVRDRMAEYFLIKSSSGSPLAQHQAFCNDALRRGVSYDATEYRRNYDSDTDQQDVAEFFGALLSCFTPTAKNLFTFRTTTTIKCSRETCSDGMRVTNGEATMLYCNIDGRPGAEMKFVDLVKKTTTEPIETLCVRCGASRCTETVRELNADQKFLVVKLDLNDAITGERLSERKITGLKVNQVSVLGKNMRVVAAILHVGASAKSGHYTCLVRKGSCWCEISDDKVLQTRKMFVSNLKNVALLFFRKKS